jgi:hypothetical protein
MTYDLNNLFSLLDFSFGIKGYPNLFGIKGFVVVVVVLDFSWK